MITSKDICNYRTCSNQGRVFDLREYPEHFPDVAQRGHPSPVGGEDGVVGAGGQEGERMRQEPDQEQPGGGVRVAEHGPGLRHGQGGVKGQQEQVGGEQALE